MKQPESRRLARVVNSSRFCRFSWNRHQGRRIQLFQVFEYGRIQKLWQFGPKVKISRNSRRFSLFLSHFRAYCSPNLLGRIAIGMLPRNHISGYRIQFLHHGKLHDFTICKVDRDEAETKTRQVEYLIMRLKQRLIVLPEPEQSRQDTGPTCAKRK